MIAELLAKAQRSAEAARALVALGASDDAASRAYYALFNTARALVIFRKPDFAAKSHGAVLAEFSRLYVKPGPLPVEWGARINRAQAARHVADYGEEVITPEEAASYVEAAADLLAFARGVVSPDLLSPAPGGGISPPQADEDSRSS